MDERVPIVVLGGWLGSGKTTLVNRTLEHCARTRPERIALVVNDVGDVNIDASLIADHDGDTIELTDGCICCSIGESLAITLRDLLGRSRWDRIVVEASGVAEPARVAAYGSRRVLAPQGAAVCVDATDVAERIADVRYGPLARRQLRQADVLLLTKTDLVDPARVEAVEDLCKELAPGAPTVTASPEALLELEAHELGPVPDAAQPLGLATRTWVPRGPVDIDQLVRVLEGSGLLRAKGFVVSAVGVVSGVQLAAGRAAVTAAPADAHPSLVLIGESERAVSDVVVALQELGSG